MDDLEVSAVLRPLIEKIGQALTEYKYIEGLAVPAHVLSQCPDHLLRELAQVYSGLAIAQATAKGIAEHGGQITVPEFEYKDEDVEGESL